MLGIGCAPACGSPSAAAEASGLPFDAATGGKPAWLPESIEFAPSDPVSLNPGQTETRTVRVQPAGSYEVRLALLGDSVDAALSQSALLTSAGMGEFSITASSKPAFFAVRASIESLVALLPVSVSSEGFATLNVTGIYSGARQASQWVASLRSGDTCQGLGNQLPEDGPSPVSSLEPVPSITIPSVPIMPETPVALVLRGDHLLWGCTDVPVLKPDTDVDLSLPLYDVAVSYPASPVQAAFELSGDASDWANHLATVAPQILSGFVLTSTSDAELLLSSMTSSVGASDGQVELNRRRQEGAWDAIVTQAARAACSSEKCLERAVSRWLAQGAASITQGSSIQTRLSLSSNAVSLNQVQLTLESMQGLAAGAWVTSTQVPLESTVGANDDFRGHTYFTFSDGLFLRLLAQLAAIAEYPDAADIPQALAMAVDCDGLATQFDESAPAGSAGCGPSCLAQLCKAALRNSWLNTEAVANARPDSLLDLNFTGKLRLDNHAVVVGCDGTWRGSIAAPDGSTVDVSGTVH